jgi:hypothetical protein
LAFVLAWVGAGERPGRDVLVGGSLVIGALVFNELVGWKEQGMTEIARSDRRGGGTGRMHHAQSPPGTQCALSLSMVRALMTHVLLAWQ